MPLLAGIRHQCAIEKRFFDVDDDDDNVTPGGMKSAGDCLVINTTFLPSATPFIDFLMLIEILFAFGELSAARPPDSVS